MAMLSYKHEHPLHNLLRNISKDALIVLELHLKKRQRELWFVISGGPVKMRPIRVLAMPVEKKSMEASCNIDSNSEG